MTCKLMSFAHLHSNNNTMTIQPFNRLGIHNTFVGPAINVGFEFRDRGSIPSVCQITDADLGQVG